MKSDRQNVILQVISEQAIETQGQLIEALKQRGVKSTQATLSRDMKDLQLVKELDSDGKYRYTVSGRSVSTDHSQRLKKIFRESISNYAVAQNIVVIKTLPGLASAACSTLDSMQIENLVGTIAGDDTAFLAMKDNESALKFCHEIDEMF